MRRMVYGKLEKESSLLSRGDQKGSVDGEIFVLSLERNNDHDEWGRWQKSLGMFEVNGGAVCIQSGKLCRKMRQVKSSYSYPLGNGSH